MKLTDLPIASVARVSVLDVDPAIARRLRAVGVFEDEAIVVLRRAPFGGPLHVRTSSGGEFALDRRLAVAIEVLAEIVPSRSVDELENDTAEAAE